jgi:hypothetical protein
MLSAVRNASAESVSVGLAVPPVGNVPHWCNVDLTGAQLAVVQSAEQTKASVRYKEPKGGCARTIALSATVVAELKARRIAQAQELLKVGKHLADDDFVVAQADGRRCGHIPSDRNGCASWPVVRCPVFAFTI